MFTEPTLITPQSQIHDFEITKGTWSVQLHNVRFTPPGDLGTVRFINMLTSRLNIVNCLRFRERAIETRP
jgi:hypothetical protein